MAGAIPKTRVVRRARVERRNVRFAGLSMFDLYKLQQKQQKPHKSKISRKIWIYRKKEVTLPTY